MKLFRSRRRKRRVILLLMVLVILIAAEELSFLYIVPEVYSTGPNAIWLRHLWVTEKHRTSEYEALAERLTEVDADDVFVHAYPLKPDGAMSADRMAYATDLVKNLKKLEPNVRLQVWLGYVRSEGGAPPDLDSKIVRDRIIKTAEKFLDIGFEGIHYDFEPIRSGDRGFIELLKATRKITKKRGVVLSVSVPEAEPVPGIEAVAGAALDDPGFISRKYFLEIAREVDQVAVMCYDSAIPLPGLYARSIARTAGLAAEKDVKQLYIGIPTYGKTGPAHILWVENINNALTGLKHGVGGLRPGNRSEVGAAIFAEWTTSDVERKDFKARWLSKD